MLDRRRKTYNKVVEEETGQRERQKRRLRLQSCVSFQLSLWLHRGETQGEKRKRSDTQAMTGA